MSPSAEQADAPNLAAAPAVEAVLQDGEAVIVAIKPSGWFVLLSSLQVIVVSAAMVAIAYVGNEILGWRGLQYHFVSVICAILVLGRIFIACAQWVGRLYLLTDRRIITLRGISRPQVRQCPLKQVAKVAPIAAAGERLLGLGTLLFDCEDEEPFEIVWLNIARPAEVHQLVLDAISRAR